MRRLIYRLIKWRIVQTAKLKWRFAKLLPLYTRHKYLARFALRKVNNAFRYSSMFLCLLAVSFYFVSQGAEAAVTVDTSTNSGATQSSYQRKTWYDGTRFWVAFYSGTAIEFWYSTNGSSWIQNTTVTSPVNTSDFSIEANSSSMYIIFGASGVVSASKAVSYPGITFTLSGQTTVFPSTFPPTYSSVSISKDANNRLRAMAKESNTNLSYVSKLSTNADDITAWGSLETIDTATANSNKYGVVSPLSSADMYSVWTDGAAIEGKKNTAGTWDTNPTAIATGISGASTNMSMVSNGGEEAYLSYIDSAGKNVFQKYVDKQGGDGVKIDDVGDPGAQSGSSRKLVRTSTGNLYTFINDGGSCEIWKSIDNGTNWTQQDFADSITCTNAVGISMAIDGTNVLHLLYGTSTPTLSYQTFNTTTDQFSGSPDTLHSGSLSGSFDISVDTNNIPHVVWTFFVASVGNIRYGNKVSGSWSTISIESVSGVTFSNLSLTIDEDNYAEFSYINDLDSDLTVVAADRNNPSLLSHFTLLDVDTTVIATSGVASTSIAIDYSGNTWVAYVDDSLSDRIFLVKHNDADAWATWQTPVDSNFVANRPSITISGSVVYVLFDTGGAILSQTYDGISWTQANVLKSTSKITASVRWAYNSNYKHGPLDYLYSDGTDIYYSNVGFWNEPTTIDGNTGNSYTSISISASNEMYIYWIRSNVVYYSKASSPYTSWSGATSLYSTGTNTWLTSITNGTPCGVPYFFTNGSVSPYSVTFDDNSVNCAPSAPSLSSPLNGITVSDTTPDLQMAATDPESNTIKYYIYIYNTPANDGTNCSGSSFESQDQNVAQGGWSQSGAYTSAATATYTVQTTMTRGSSYCWQAKAKDPANSNAFSALSTPRTFTINSIPGTPAAVQPVVSATNNSLTPEFRFYASDVDNDYLRYKVYLYQSDCTTAVTSYQQPSGTPQTGWTGQSTQSGTAYASGQTAIYTAQSSLITSTTYCWKVSATDTGGSGVESSLSSGSLFTTTATAPKQEINIGGSTTINGGTTIGN